MLVSMTWRALSPRPYSVGRVEDGAAALAVTRACTCAAAAFICKAPAAATSRETRQARERGGAAAAEAKATRRTVDEVCGLPCALSGPKDVCSSGGVEDAEATCIGRGKYIMLATSSTAL